MFLTCNLSKILITSPRSHPKWCNFNISHLSPKEKSWGMQTNPCPVWRVIQSCKCFTLIMIKQSIWNKNGFQFQPHSPNLSPPGTLHSTQTCSFNIREIKAAPPVMICGCWSECAKQISTFTIFFHIWEIPSFGFQRPFSTEFLHIIFSFFSPSTAMATSFKLNMKCCFSSWNCSVDLIRILD